MRSLFAAVLAVSLALGSNGVLGQTSSWTEFMSGQRVTYNSAGNAKAKGVEISFEYPASWGGAEGKRPNVVYQVTSEGGRGLEICNLLVKDLPLPNDYRPTPAELDDLFDESTIAEFVPKGGELVKSAKTTVDGQPGAWFQFNHEMDRVGIKLRMSWLSYAAYFDRKIITFSCAVGTGADQPATDLQKKFQANARLFQMLANSLIIHSKWQRRP